MPTFYHVDRARGLQAGQFITLTAPPPQSHEIETVLQRLPGRELSRFGERYLLAGAPEGWLELYVEAVRSDLYSNRPSRYRTVHAAPDLRGAELFRARFAAPNDHANQSAPIWEVTADAAFITDMELLSGDGSGAGGAARIERYWQGLASTSGLRAWEALVVPPVSVGQQVA